MFQGPKQDPIDVPTPPPGSFTWFVDQFGVPSIKRDDGSVVPSATLLGGPVPLDEQPSNPIPVADRGHVISRDVGGVTELHYVDDQDRPIQLTANGSPAGGGGSGGGAFYASAQGVAELEFTDIPMSGSQALGVGFDIVLPAGVFAILPVRAEWIGIDSNGAFSKEMVIANLLFNDSVGTAQDRLFDGSAVFVDGGQSITLGPTSFLADELQFALFNNGEAINKAIASVAIGPAVALHFSLAP